MADTAPMLPQLQAMLDRAKSDAAKRESARIYQFPFWPEPDRGIPNEFSRSALFVAIQAKGRTYLDNEEIASQEGYTITYTGQRLDQTHLDVFEGLMHIACGIHEGNKIRFSAHSFLKLIGRDTGNAQHKWLLKAMNHLTATSVQIKRGTAKVFWGSLLPKGHGRPDSGDYEVEITRELIQLFDRGFTQVDWEQRRLWIERLLREAGIKQVMRNPGLGVNNGALCPIAPRQNPSREAHQIRPGNEIDAILKG